MKKILLSLSVIALVGASAYVGSTGAFFSDSETSTGNTFTAGAIDLTVDSTQHYNNVVCVNNAWQLAPNQTIQPAQYPAVGSACDGSWAATDLGPANKFFNFGDIKPGDQGENTISMHIDNNSAWACADIHTTSNAENTAINPELKAGDSAANGNFDGELAQNVQFFTWLDNASTNGAVPGDNIWQASESSLVGPIALFSTIGGTTTLPIADSTTANGALVGGNTSYIGMAWCAGTMNVSVPGTITCNGATMGNNAQTDSATANITLRVEQERNNASFVCSTPVEVAVNAANLAVSAFSPTGWYLYDDQTDLIQTNSAGHQFIVGPATPPVGTGSVNFTKTTTDKFGIATNQLIGTQFSTIGALQFSTYRSAGSSAQAVSLGFDIDSNTTDGDTSYQGRLTYEPYFTHTVNTGIWETWNTQDNAGTGNWWFSHANLSGGAPSVCTQADPCTWSEVTAAYPNMAISGRTILRTNGADNQVADLSTDKLLMKIGLNTTVYNFGN